MTSIAAVVADVVSLPEQINTYHGIWYAVTHLENAFFSPSLSLGAMSSSLLSGPKANNTLSLSYLMGLSILYPYVIISQGYFLDIF